MEVNNTYSSKRIQMDNIDIFIRAPSPHVKQSDCVKNKGLWNYEDETCYKYFMLRTLCLILDQKTQNLYRDYKHFKCNGFNEWYESFSLFPWNIPSYDPTFDDLEAINKRIRLYLSTDKDPFVWANYNGTLHFSNLAESYSVAGVWLITCAIALVIIPLLVYFKDNTITEVPEDAEQKEEEAYQLKVSSARNINPSMF